MTKIKVKPIRDTDTAVPVNDGEHRINEIKARITTGYGNEFSTVSVYEMWEDKIDE